MPPMARVSMARVGARVARGSSSSWAPLGAPKRPHASYDLGCVPSKRTGNFGVVVAAQRKHDLRELVEGWGVREQGRPARAACERDQHAHAGLLERGGRGDERLERAARW